MAKAKYPKDGKGKPAKDPKGGGKDWAKDDEKSSKSGKPMKGCK